MSEHRSIPFCKPFIGEKESQYVAQALRAGTVKSGGPFSKASEELLQRELGAAQVLLTTSGSTALDLAALVLDLQPGDEVILPSFTFTATANAIALRGATPVFADIRSDTLNIDAAQVESLVTERTKAVACVHYAGVACEMDALVDITKRHGLTLLEDHAHGPFASYKGKPLGSFGALAALSFQEAKNYCAGECGALVVNDEALVARAYAAWDKGTNRRDFLQGRVPHYEWVALGTNFAPSELLGALLLAQLEQREQIQQARKRVWDYYHQGLAEWAGQHGVGLPQVPAHAEQAYHMFYLLLPTPGARDALLRHLQSRGIQAIFHFSPLHSSAMGRRCGRASTELPVTDRVCSTILRLPFYNALTAEEQDFIVESIKAFPLPV